MSVGEKECKEVGAGMGLGLGSEVVLVLESGELDWERKGREGDLKWKERKWGHVDHRDGRSESGRHRHCQPPRAVVRRGVRIRHTQRDLVDAHTAVKLAF